MKKRSAQPVLKRRYKALEEAEALTRKKLTRLYRAHAAEVAAMVAAAYGAATVDGKPTHAGLMRRADSKELIRIQREVAKLRREMPHGGAFPFSVTKFDKLNRLEALRADLVISECKLAADVEEIIMAHLKQHVEACWIEFEEWWDYYNAAMTAGAIAAILTDERYPIRETLYSHAVKIAGLTANDITSAIISGQDEETAEAHITAQNERREQTAADNTLYYEGTRTTIATLDEVVKDFVLRFRSVCIHDGKACELCLRIEDAQRREPVPVEDLKPGETAPPFHNNCRCGVEVVFDDDYQEDEEGDSDGGTR